MTRLFITGGTGFIARHYLNACKNQFDAICAPQRKRSPDSEGHIRTPFTDGSVENLSDLLTEFQPDAILNFAAAGVKPDERGEEYLSRINTALPVELYKSAKLCGASSFVQIGSMAEYAQPDQAIRLCETDALTQSNPYGRSKANASRALASLAGEDGPHALILRLFGVYGPGEAPHRLTHHILTQAKLGAVVSLSAGTQQRDFIYIKDVITAIHAGLQVSLKKTGGHDIVNIGSGEAISVKDFVFNFCKAGSLDTSGLKFGALPMRDTDAPYLVANIEKAYDLLGWSPEWTGKAGLDDFFKMI